MENSNFRDLTPLFQPGIYEIYSIATGRALFCEGLDVFANLQDFYDDLIIGVCENENLLKDFQTFGIDNFKFIIVAVGPEFSDPKKRKNRLEEEKSNWPAELLY